MLGRAGTRVLTAVECVETVEADGVPRRSSTDRAKCDDLGKEGFYSAEWKKDTEVRSGTGRAIGGRIEERRGEETGAGVHVASRRPRLRSRVGKSGTQRRVGKVPYIDEVTIGMG